MTSTPDSTGTSLTDALLHLRSAIDILDSADAPGQIAAYVDLALNQLEEMIALQMWAHRSPANDGADVFGNVQPS